jgi:anti-sigma-K factor RskA
MSDRTDIPSDRPPERPDDDALAAEYALGLLEGEERAAFERRLSEEPDLRAALTRWEADFAALAHEVPDVAPPAATRARILAAVAPPAASQGARFGWLFPPIALVVALAAFLLIVPALRGPVFDPTLHATLASEDGSLLIEAGYAPDGSLFRVIREEGAPAPGRDLELWVIGPDAAAPVSLGVLPADAVTTFEIPAEIADLIEGGVLAVSDEPPGGSPTGAPTGDILATGAFRDV